jgi:hypothetical protein
VFGAANAVTDANLIGGVVPKNRRISEVDQLARRLPKTRLRTDRPARRINANFSRLVRALIAASRFEAELRSSLASW